MARAGAAQLPVATVGRRDGDNERTMGGKGKGMREARGAVRARVRAAHCRASGR